MTTEVTESPHNAKGKDVVNSKYYLGSVANMRNPRAVPTIEVVPIEEEALICGTP